MNRWMLFAMATSAASVGAVSMLADPPVNLQSATPGVAQTGHLNISGTAIAGMFKGTGSLLTGLNASALASGTITLTGSSPTYLIRGSNSSGAANASALIGIVTSGIGTTYGGWFESKSTSGRALFGYASAPTGATYGTYAQNNSNAGRASFGLATATTGNTYGGWFQSNSPDGVGLFAKNSTGTALSVDGPAKFNDFAAIGPRASAIGTNELLRLSSATTSSSAGMYVSTGTGGKPYYGYNNGTNDAFTYLAATGILRFNVKGTESFGLHGNGDVSLGGSAAPTHRFDIRGDDSARAALVGVTNGGPGGGYAAARRGLLVQSFGSSSLLTLGVQGVASGASNPCYGVAGMAQGTGINYGVYGFASGGTSNYAGFFDGLIYAQSATAGVKSFLIDHPLDPANKFLEHSSIESDERKNMYDGVTTTDARGYAMISLPAWFDALNEDFRYQLTVVDSVDSESFSLVKVTQELKNNKFRIRSSTPKTKVSWQVTGRRHDPTSDTFPLQIERNKNSQEKGKYLVPEAYGKDPSFGLAGQANRPGR